MSQFPVYGYFPSEDVDDFVILDFVELLNSDLITSWFMSCQLHYTIATLTNNLFKFQFI